jgi:hypothetical protein
MMTIGYNPLCIIYTEGERIRNSLYLASARYTDFGNNTLFMPLRVFMSCRCWVCRQGLCDHIPTKEQA